MIMHALTFEQWKGAECNWDNGEDWRHAQRIARLLIVCPIERENRADRRAVDQSLTRMNGSVDAAPGVNRYAMIYNSQLGNQTHVISS